MSYAEHADGLAELQTELGAGCPSFAWRGLTVRCLASAARRSKEIESGGFGIESDLSLTCLRSALGYGTDDLLVAALLKSQLVYIGHTYRVESVIVAPGGKWVTIGCADFNKGA